jgi:type II secretory pathway pseudopilin PulG
MEQIYNTPPGSSSSDKLQSLHSPYAIMVDSVSSAASTFDMLNQFSQESIIAPFESITVEDHSSYHPLKNSLPIKSTKRYEPSKSLSISLASHHKPSRHWKRTLTTNDYSSSPFNNSMNTSQQQQHQQQQQQQQQQQLHQQQQQIMRQQHTPRSVDPRNTSMSMNNVPTPTIYSPMNNNPSIRSIDPQSSPFPIRSVGSVQAINSPTTSYSHTNTLTQPEVDSLLFNVLLNDSILNLFRDMNFDSCVLCACTPNELNIRGTDSTIYLEKPRDPSKPSISSTNNPTQNQTAPSPYHSHMYPHQQSPYHMHPHTSMYNQGQAASTASINHHHNPNQNNNSCSCGFSAVVNLRLSYLSGLFYEDEIEITGIKTDLKYRTSNDTLSVHLLDLIERKECLPSPFDSFLQKHTMTTSTTKKTEQDISNIVRQPVYQCKHEQNDRSLNNMHIQSLF